MDNFSTDTIAFSPREQVVQGILTLIHNRSLRPEAELPAENALALRWGVSRGTVRSGLAELAERGVLEKHGRRLRVATVPPLPDSMGGGLMRRTLVSFSVAAPDDLRRRRNTGYNDAVQAGAGDELLARGCCAMHLNIAALPPSEQAELLRHRPGGLLLFHPPEPSEQGPSADVSLFERLTRPLLEQGIPAVGSSGRTLFPGVDYVTSDHAAGVRLLVDALLASGRRRLLCYLPRVCSHYWMEERGAGYAAALRDAGLAPLPRPATCYSSGDSDRWTRERFLDEVRRAAGYLLEQFPPGAADVPDAVLAKTDWEVPVIAAALRRLGREPGRDVVVAGYDHKEIVGEWTDLEPYRPPLTVDKHNNRIGRRMVERLLEHLDEPSAWKPELLREPPELIRLPSPDRR